MDSSHLENSKLNAENDWFIQNLVEDEHQPLLLKKVQPIFESEIAELLHIQATGCIDSVIQVYKIAKASGLSEDALTHYELCLRMYEGCNLKKDPFYGAILSRIATIYYDQAKYPYALHNNKAALQIFQTENYAKTLNNIGAIYLHQNMYNKARIHFKQSLTFFVSDKQKYFEEIKTVLKNIVLMFQRKGDNTKALSFSIKYHNFIRKRLGDWCTESAPIFYKIGYFYCWKGNYEIALEQFYCSLYIYEKIGYECEEFKMIYANIGQFFDKVKGKESKNFAKNCGRIGDIYSRVKEYAWALKFLLRAYEIYRRLNDVKNVEFERILNSIARIYELQKVGIKGLPYLIQLQALYSTDEGKYNKQYSKVILKIAQIYKQQEKYEEAIKLFTEWMDIFEKANGRLGVSYARMLEKIAEIYKLQKNYNQAVQNCKAALAVLQNTEGQKSENYAKVLNHIAYIFHTRKSYNESLTYYKEAHKLYEKIKGKSSEEYVQRLKTMGSICLYLGRYTQAEHYHTEDLNIFLSANDMDCMGYALKAYYLGEVYLRQSLWEKALDIFNKCLSIYKKFDKGETKEAADCLQRVGYILMIQKQYPQALSVLQKSLALKEIHKEDTYSLLSYVHFVRSKLKIKPQQPKSAPQIIPKTQPKVNAKPKKLAFRF